MKYGLAEIDWAHIGALLANEGSDEQVVFFKAFCKEMGHYPTRYAQEMQLACVHQELTKDEQCLLSMLGDRP